MSWEDRFRFWGRPPGKTESDKMENAETAVKKAIATYDDLTALSPTVFAQGSYKARTNVRQDSDVDICVCLQSTFFPWYPPGKTKEDYGNIDGSISFPYFKSLVNAALGDYFGRENVSPGNKAFDVHSNTYRVDADVVPAFAYRRYYSDGTNNYIKPTGVGFKTDSNTLIKNWPHQTYRRGTEKQARTGERYKKLVRIIKTLRNQMQDEQIPESDDISSFLIESMVWNVPDEGFNHEDYIDDVRYVIAHCFNKTQNDERCNGWREVNNIKYLFYPTQPWTREKANKFFRVAWDYIGFKD